MQRALLATVFGFAWYIRKANTFSVSTTTQGCGSWTPGSNSYKSLDIDPITSNAVIFGCGDWITYRMLGVSGIIEYEHKLPIPPRDPPDLTNTIKILAMNHKKKDSQFLYVGLEERNTSNVLLQSWVFCLPNSLLAFHVPPANPIPQLKTFPIVNRIFYDPPLIPKPIPLLTHVISIPEQDFFLTADNLGQILAIKASSIQPNFPYEFPLPPDSIFHSREVGK